jgi:hypothetical protein
MTRKSRKSQQPLRQRTRGLSRYKRRETKRLLQSAADAGLNVRGLEVDPVSGKLRILFDTPDAPLRAGPKP